MLGNEARANLEKTARRVLYNSHDDRPPTFFDSANTGVSAAAARRPQKIVLVIPI